MKINISILKPTSLSIIMFVLAILLQAAFFTRYSYTYSYSDSTVKTQSMYGVGKPVTLNTGQDSTTYNIDWLILMLNLFACYIISNIIAKTSIKATRFHRPTIIYMTVALTMVIIAFLISVSISKGYWGYFFFRPKVLKEFSEIASVKSVIPVMTESSDSGKRKVVVNEDFSLEESLLYCKKDEYYCLEDRMLLLLEQRSLIPFKHSTTLTGLPPIFQLVKNSEILEKPEEGYNNSDLLRGLVIDAINKSGGRVVFMGLRGGSVSNDHYPYYELQFSEQQGTTNLTYSNGQKFFYDVAGIEGAEWYLIWPYLSLVGIVIGFVVVTIGPLFWRKIRKNYNSPAGLIENQTY